MIKIIRPEIITLCVFLAVALVPALAGSAKDENPAADFSLKDMNGKRVSLRDYRGKIVVLNFWATWCGPCKDEMPMLVEAEKEYGERGVVFIAASLDDKKTRGHVPAFVREHQISFPIWLGATPDDLEKLGMGPGLPATAFIDQQGHILARVLGEIRKPEVKERLDWLTGGQTGAAPPALVNHLNDK
jgi:thiol-disulfide isomerase/thioredoxin